MPVEIYGKYVVIVVAGYWATQEPCKSIKLRDGNEGKKIKLSFVILRTKQIVSGPNFRALATKKGKLLQC